MKALVTGGAGFIGSHLAQQWVADGNEVIVVDNLSTGSLKNITALVGKPGFEFVKEMKHENNMFLILKFKI